MLLYRIMQGSDGFGEEQDRKEKDRPVSECDTCHTDVYVRSDHEGLGNAGGDGTVLYRDGGIYGPDYL